MIPNEILEHGLMLQEHIKSPVYLAGGAVRDTLLGREVKDYDFFIPKFEAKNLPWEKRGKAIPVGKDYDPDFYVKEQEVDGHIVQHIIVNNPTYRVRNFDIDLCEVWINFSNMEVGCTSGFKRSIEEKAFRYYKTLSRNENHLERVKEKYPEYKVIEV